MDSLLLDVWRVRSNASRTGGGGINELGVLRFGFNIHHAWIKSQCGTLDNILQFKPARREELFGFSQIPPRVGKLVGMPAQFPFEWGAEYLPEDVLGKTRWGYETFATGGNEQAAVYAGIPTRWVRIRAYLISSLCATPIRRPRSCGRSAAAHPTARTAATGRDAHARRARANIGRPDLDGDPVHLGC